MENRIEDINNRVNEIVAKIYEKQTEIDTCNALIKNLDDGDICLLMSDGRKVGLEPAITTEQKAELMYNIRMMAKGNIDLAASFLESIISPKVESELPFVTVPQNTPAPEEVSVEIIPDVEPLAVEFEEPEAPIVPEKVKKPAAATKSGKACRMTIAEVEQLFRDGYNVEDIAKHYEYKSAVSVQNFIKKNNIKVKNLTQGNSSAKELTEENIPEIRAMYTDGPMSLTDTAWELGTTKKKLREFCEKHRLLKVKKDW